MEITMEKAWSYLHKVADARIILIEAVKDDLKHYQEGLVDIMMEIELPVKLIDLDELKSLYEVNVPLEILEALGEDCKTEYAFPGYVYKYVEIDGIKIKYPDAVRDKQAEGVA